MLFSLVKYAGKRKYGSKCQECNPELGLVLHMTMDVELGAQVKVHNLSATDMEDLSWCQLLNVRGLDPTF